jgi:hypothetical protein
MTAGDDNGKDQKQGCGPSKGLGPRAQAQFDIVSDNVYHILAILSWVR